MEGQGCVGGLGRGERGCTGPRRARQARHPCQSVSLALQQLLVMMINPGRAGACREAKHSLTNAASVCAPIEALTRRPAAGWTNLWCDDKDHCLETATHVRKCRAG